MAKQAKARKSDSFWTQIQKAAKRIDGRGKTDIFLYNGLLEYPGDVMVIREFKKHKQGENVLLILSTFGGDANVAYRIGRYLQENYKKRTICVPYICKSAGTLLAIAADEIVMLPEAELGPLDVQLSKPGELGEQESGWSIIQTLDSLQGKAFEAFEDYLVAMRVKSRYQISTKSALETAATLAVGLFSEVYKQIDPIRLGENSRALTIADKYGSRLNDVAKNLQDDALETLIRSYPSHDFVIDFSECKKRIFKNLRNATDNENVVLRLLRLPLRMPYTPKDRSYDDPALIWTLHTQTAKRKSTPKKTIPIKKVEDKTDEIKPQGNNSGNRAGQKKETSRVAALA